MIREMATTKNCQVCQLDKQGAKNNGVGGHERPFFDAILRLR